MTPKPRVAFVVQRCGYAVNGGAERHGLAIAIKMASVWNVDIVTTCATDHLTWANDYPPGDTLLERVTIRRFPVLRPRHMPSFNLHSRAIKANSGRNTRAAEEAWMRAQGPWSPALLDFLTTHRTAYDAFIFFTYLYATTYFGLPRVADRAFLVPTAHDEWPIHLSIFDDLFARPRGFVFNTIEERDFLRNRFPRVVFDGPIAGVAVSPPRRVDAERFRRRYGITAPFLIYVGRIDPQKGVRSLIDDFARYRESARARGRDIDLVLVGKPFMDLPPTGGVHAIGFVDDQTKWDAIAASSALVMPSPLESLSLACLEAWSLTKPVIVNGACDVLVGQCRRSEGGLWYRDATEFATACDAVLRGKARAARLGENGRAFTTKTYAWPVIVAAFQDLLGCGQIDSRGSPT
ncbi:MAG: glycosyltransferase family 4 protein [Deltaproteobacteria bacterium]|nr:glycosyltransferase family 4 protein [Deltaproteobacteria bacterium]